MNPYALGGIVIAVLALLAGLFFGVQREINSAHEEGRALGREETDAAYKERDNHQLLVVSAERERLAHEKADLERQRDADISKAEGLYASKLARQQADFDSFIADINAGRVVWRDPGETRAGAPCGDRSPARALAEGAGGGDGQEQRGAFSRETAQFLSTEAHRADAVLEKLNLCRGVLKTIYDG